MSTTTPPTVPPVIAPTLGVLEDEGTTWVLGVNFSGMGLVAVRGPSQLTFRK